MRRGVSWLREAPRAVDDLRRANADLAELRRRNEALEEQLAARTAELEATSRELASFTYTVSHDLRAPLRAMDGFSQAVLEDHADKLDAQGRADLARINAACKRMGEMIEGLLQLSRVARAELHRGPVDLSALARNVIAELQRTAPDRRVETIVGEGYTVDGDVRLLRIAVQSLVGNAWKFTQRAEHPRIEVGSDAGQGAFFVRDNGAGFDMKHAEKLFRPFQRLHAATEFPGTGIGLATAERIVARHGGRLWAHAEPGAGATFYVALPVRAPAAG